jgi:nucleotidyltransferase/DNA polymerase involved in DNA repair
MASKKQIQANRRNALKSTGPKTLEGKDTARLNATKHGLLSQEVLLPGEDEEALKELAERLRAELQPVGEMEGLLVERIIDATWRLRRLSRVEAGIFTWELYEELAERAKEEAQTYEESTFSDVVEKYYGPSSTRITDEEKHQETTSRAEEMRRKQQRAETATLGRTFTRDANTANAFSKLSRYETGIEGKFYKAYHELQRLQAARRAEGNVPPPVAIDVDVSGASGEGLR